MVTYQDFMNSKEGNLTGACEKVIQEWKSTRRFLTARMADAYDRQENKGIIEATKTIYNLQGREVKDDFAKTMRIPSNFFHRLNTQRNMYVLANGVFFEDTKTKEKLGGGEFDKQILKASYKALIHGVSFLFYDYGRVRYFEATEFAPLWDEETSQLRAGIRFWRLAKDKPLNYILFEEDGYTTFVKPDTGVSRIVEEKRGYIEIKTTTPADGEVAVEYTNYDNFPIVPLYGNELKQSTLVGMKHSIDSYDLINSGFAEDLIECQQVYWLISGADGMSEKDVAKFRDNLRVNKMAVARGGDNTSVTPYSNEVPYNARQVNLEMAKKNIYTDFGALDVSSLSGSATATEINASYQPLDEEACDLEYQLITSIRQILKLAGIEDKVSFKFNKITNQYEITQMIMMTADYLDEETLLLSLPFLTPDQVDTIIENKKGESLQRYGQGTQVNE